MSILNDLRADYLKRICARIIARRIPTKRQKTKRKCKSYLNFADGDNEASIILADKLIEIIGCPIAAIPPKEQKAGSMFTELTRNYIETCFTRLKHIRPGKWEFTTRQAAELIAEYDQYAHLSDLAQLTKDMKELAAVLGRNYFVRPDIILGRSPLSDNEINEFERLVEQNEKVVELTPLRKANLKPLRVNKGRGQNYTQILHASISCKWTLRSDRAQNSRTEALNLIRHRKGNTPHIVVVTMEPLPSRLASIALGTGDVDCTYHAALHELHEAAIRSDLHDSRQYLEEMIEGRRLRDISDLPLDLAV